MKAAAFIASVLLVKTDPVHVGHWGTYVATTSLAGFQRTITGAKPRSSKPKRLDGQWQPDFDILDAAATR